MSTKNTRDSWLDEIKKTAKEKTLKRLDEDGFNKKSNREANAQEAEVVSKPKTKKSK